MKVLWITNIMMPEFARELGLSPSNAGGWMPSLIAAIRQYEKGVELIVLSEGPFDASKVIEGVSYYAVKAINSSRMNRARTRKHFETSVARIIARSKPDLIHFHGTEYGYLSFPESVWQGVPRLVTLQGIITGSYPHYMGGLTDLELKPHRNLLRTMLTGSTMQSAAEKWRTINSVNEVKSLKDVRFVGGRTDWDRAWAHTLAPDAEYLHIGEVLRPEFYLANNDYSKVVSHRIYASAALSYPLKGGHWLLRAVSFLKRDYSDVKVCFADSQRFMGDCGWTGHLRLNEYHRYLRKLVRDLKIQDNVEFFPSLSAGGVVAELEKAEIFCLPSLVENSPNSLGEAGMLGMPSVVTDVGGVTSMVRHEKDALIVPSADPACLAAAIGRLFEDGDLRIRLGSSIRTSSIARHAPEKVLEGLMVAYRRVAKGE